MDLSCLLTYGISTLVISENMGCGNIKVVKVRDINITTTNNSENNNAIRFLPATVTLET